MFNVAIVLDAIITLCADEDSHFGTGRTLLIHHVVQLVYYILRHIYL